jgi:hypothetical protein
VDIVNHTNASIFDVEIEYRSPVDDRAFVVSAGTGDTLGARVTLTSIAPGQSSGALEVMELSLHDREVLRANTTWYSSSLTPEVLGGGASAPNNLFKF